MKEEALGLELLEAGENGDLSKIETIIAANPELVNFQDQDGYTALHRAAYSDQTPCLEFLLTHNAAPMARTKDGWTPLHSAARWNAASCLQILIKYGCDINAKSDGGQTALHVAAQFGAIECLTLLLLNPVMDAKAHNNAGDTAADLASRSGNYSYLFDLARDSINKF